MSQTLNKKKIYIVCPFPQGEAAGQRLKYEQHFHLWVSNGYEIQVSSFMDEALWKVVYTKGNNIKKFLGVLRGYKRRLFDLFIYRKFDLVYVFMWGTPFGSSLYERLIRLLSRCVIYDIEDNVMMEQSSALNPITRLLRGAGKTKYLIKTADHVVTSSPFLSDYARELNQKNQSVLISGESGAGKTEALLSIAYNALCQGSGFIYVDGKGDNSLFAKVFSMVRSMGREDDLMVVNFMTGGSDIIGPQSRILSNTMNPFALGSSSMLSNLVVSLMDSGSSGSSDGDMWKGRAISFIEEDDSILSFMSAVTSFSSFKAFAP